MFLTEDEIFKALKVLSEAEEQLRTDVDIIQLARYFLHMDTRRWFPADQCYPPHAIEKIKALNGPHGKTYAATLLIKYCT